MASFDRLPRLWNSPANATGLDLSNGADPALLEALPDPTGLFDADNRLVASNVAFRQLFSLTSAQVLAGVDMDLLARVATVGASPDELQVIQPQDLLSAMGATEPLVRRVGGSVVQLHVAKARGQRVLSLRPVDPVAAGMAPAHLAGLLAHAVRAGQVELAWWDPNHRCRYASEAFLRSVGRNRQQTLGRLFSELVEPQRRVELLPRLNAAANGQPQHFEERRRMPDGSEQILEQHWLPAGGHMPGWISIARDVTQLHAARDDVQRAGASRTQFVTNVNHELRTPMTTVMGMLELLELSGLSGSQRALAGRAMTAARALLHVAETLVEFADVETGRLQLQPEPFELDRLLRELSQQLGEAAADRGLTLVFELDPGLPQALVGDHRRIRQLLWQLCSNALKFTETGTITLSVRMISRGLQAAKLDFSVADTGLGIAPERLRQLMNEVGQSEGTPANGQGGLGLGLALCRRLLRAMDGRLHASSEPGKGSRFGFTMRLPVADVEVQRSPGAWRVLIADAEDARRQAHVRAALALGWRVTEARSLDEIMRVLRDASHLQAALIDVSLSKADAPLAAALSAAAHPAAVPVVVTGGPDVRLHWEQLVPGQRRQISACLARPATSAMLVEAVAQACASTVGRTGQNAAGGALAGLRLLLVEDNASSQMVALELLGSQGAEVEVCADGLDALTSLVAGGRYDAILMDWQMPNMDGLDATREIRQIHGLQHIPIIALTASGTVADRAACLAAGMDDHLSKPIALDELVRVVLRHTRPGQQLERARAEATAAPLPTAAPLSLEELPEGEALPGGFSDTLPATELEYLLPSEPESQATRPAALDLPVVSLLDSAAALDRLGHDQALYRSLAEHFGSVVPEGLDALDAALQSGELAQARRLAHTLKGQSATMGADALARAAGAVEMAINRGDPVGPLDLLQLRELAGPTLAALQQATAADLAAPRALRFA